MRRVAIYARADDVPDARERLDIQIATVTAFVRRRGDWHVATYADVGPRAPSNAPASPGCSPTLAAAASTWSWSSTARRSPPIQPAAVGSATGWGWLACP